MSVNKDKSTWRLVTPGGISLKIVERSGSFEREGASAQEKCIIRSEDLYAFLLETFPLPYTFLNTIIYPTVRRMPAFPVLQSTRITWKALTDGKPVDPFDSDPFAPDGTYDENLELTIDYSTNNGTGGANDQDPDPNDPFTFLEVSSSTGGNFIYTPSRGSLMWEGGIFSGPPMSIEGDVEIKDRDIPITISQPETEWTVKWTQIPFEFFDDTLIERLRERLGKVNSTAMPVFFNAPPETILFVGWTMRQQFTWRPGLVGKPPIEIELKFSEKNFVANDGIQVTHNHFYRISGRDNTATVSGYKPGWRKVLVATGAGTKYIHETIDLNAMFAP